MSNDSALVQKLYAGFNARNIDAVLAELADDVAWANGMEGGHVHGKAAVREYWTRQWAVISPRVEPQQMTERGDHSVEVEVHQLVHDLQGTLLLDETVLHVFTVRDGKVKRFDIQSASKLSAIAH